MCTVLASWRVWISSIFEPNTASKTGMMWLPESVKMRRVPAASSARISASAPRCWQFGLISTSLNGADCDTWQLGL
jgi:hypothetical protein